MVRKDITVFCAQQQNLFMLILRCSSCKLSPAHTGRGVQGALFIVVNKGLTGIVEISLKIFPIKWDSLQRSRIKTSHLTGLCRQLLTGVVGGYCSHSRGDLILQWWEESGEEQKQPSNITLKNSWGFSYFSAEPEVISKDLLATRQGGVRSVSGTVCDLLRGQGKAASAQ